MGKILLIEDEGAIRNHLKEKLREKHEVKHANNCTSAIGLWKKYYGSFDCIILDLNILPEGLEDEEADKYFPIHGILILNKICKEEIPDEEKWNEWKKKTQEAKQNEIWGKTVVYSAYTEQLKSRKKEFLPQFNYLVKLISKEEETCVDDLLKTVNNFIMKGGNYG